MEEFLSVLHSGAMQNHPRELKGQEIKESICFYSFWASACVHHRQSRVLASCLWCRSLGSDDYHQDNKRELNIQSHSGDYCCAHSSEAQQQ